MPTDNERFFEAQSFAVVGHTGERPFPKLTYGNLKKLGKTVYPVDLSGAQQVEGDPAFAGLDALPGPVEAAILELPRDRVAEVVGQAADAGIKNVWLHQGTDTPEALELGRQRGLNLRHGTCAVMYTQQGASFHSIHKWIMKMLGKY